MKGQPLRGGLSEVRKAFDRETRSTVAVKLINGAPDDDVMTRTFFNRETTTLQALSHPNIVKMLDSGWDPEEGRYYIILEWVPRSLANVFSEEGPYIWEDLSTKIALPIASALEHAHLKKVEHRDIKPSNILITDTGDPKLADFGIAKIYEQIITSGMTVGPFKSAPYAPPEQYESNPYLRDIYSFGVLITQSLTATKLRKHADVFEALKQIEVPPNIRSLLADCIDPDPELRPQNGAVILQRLTELVDGSRAQKKAKRNYIWLRLTLTAKRSLRQIYGADTDEPSLANLVELDLSQEVHIEYRFDPEAKTEDIDTIFVMGRELFLVLKRSDDKPAFNVVGVQQKSPEELHHARSRSFPLGRVVTWTCSAPRIMAYAESGMGELISVLEDHVEEKQRIRENAEKLSNQNQLFDQWLKLLDAREDLARGIDRPIRYTNRSNSGRNYEFTLAEPLERDVLGSEWQVTVAEARRPIGRGEVVAQTEMTLTIRFPGRGKSFPKSGQLAPYLGPAQTSLQRQREAVLKVKKGSAVRPELREIILDPSAASPPSPVDIPNWKPKNLDLSKIETVRHALGSEDLFLIQGPPGTGKTSVIAEIVSQFIESNPNARILIVSQTHVAVDNALERLDKVGLTGLVRLGRPEDPRIGVEVKHLLLDMQIGNWAKKIRHQAEAHLTKRSREHGVEADHLRAALVLEQLAAVLADISIVSERIDNDKHETTSSSDLVTGLDLAEDTIDSEERLHSLLEVKDELIQLAREHLAGDLTLRDEISSAEARDAVEVLLGNSDTSRNLLDVLRLQGEWLQRLTSDRNLASAYLQTAKVVAGTCIGFLGNPSIRDLEFDLCILDEASKATATEALVPLARAKRWVLVGDTSQLPPMDEDVLRSQDLMSEYQLDSSIIETSLFERLVQKTSFPVQHLLTEQYRMSRPIGDMISTCFYEGKLKSPIEKSIIGYSNIAKPVLWLDTSGLGGRRREDEMTGGSTSVANRTEAHLVVRRITILETAIDRKLVKRDSDDPLQILVIAPYRRQIEEIERRLAAISLNHVKVTVQSVDAVQGKEADLAIFSVTRSNVQGQFGFLGEPYWRRINVALSRARYGLTIIGDAGFCRSSPGALRDVLDYMELNQNDCEIRAVDND